MAKTFPNTINVGDTAIPREDIYGARPGLKLSKYVPFIIFPNMVEYCRNKYHLFDFKHKQFISVYIFLKGDYSVGIHDASAEIADIFPVQEDYEGQREQFRQELKYAFETLWGDAPSVTFEDEQ